MIARRMADSVRKQTLSDELYQDLLKSIRKGEFKQNSRLPTEADLSHNYGVSRSTVRKALARLKSEGYAESRQGSGSVVISLPPSDADRFMPIESLADLENCFECRISLEGEIAFYAAQRRTEDMLSLLARHISKMESILVADQMHTNEDTEFHILLAKASGNRLFETMMASIRPFILFGMNISKTLSKSAYRRHARASLEEHKLVIDAIRNSDGVSARDAMRTHLGRARNRIFKGT